MSEQQSSTQVGIIVVAHADYGSAMLRTAEFILGTLSDCTSISVDIAQEVPETVRRLDDAAQRLDKGAGVIILTDMFGGTPTNLALSLLGSHNVEVVTLQQIATYYDQRFLTFLSFLKFRYESDMNMKNIDQLKKISIEKVILEKQKTHILMPQELEMVK